MAMNKNALIRYKTIDKCLQNKYRKWTLADLIEACSDALYEYEGKDVNVSKRTLQLDIQLMRSDKLGYNAPIEVYERKYYRYADEDYSITDIPLTENDMNILSETVEMLKQFKDFSLFQEMNGIIQKFEDKIYAEREHSAPIIHLEKNDHLKGLEHLDTLYQAILKKMVLRITYKSFKARKAKPVIFHPFILKQFNNRWFLVGVKDKEFKTILTLALDRMIDISIDIDHDYYENDFDGDAYYKNTIGVTVRPDEQVEEIIFKVDAYNSPYVVTKPFHHSQKLLGVEEGNHIFSMNVVLNFELERLLLGFGESLEVLFPRQLRRRLKKKFNAGAALYEQPVGINKSELISNILKR